MEVRSVRQPGAATREQLAAAVEVDRIGIVLFRVAAAQAAEDAVGADVNQASAGAVTQRRKLMRE